MTPGELCDLALFEVEMVRHANTVTRILIEEQAAPGSHYRSVVLAAAEADKAFSVFPPCCWWREATR